MKGLLIVMLLAWMNSAMAEFTIPQDVLDVVSQDGSVRIMVRLDVPFTPEGVLSSDEIVAQRSQITDAQDTFETELKKNINGSKIDDPSGVGSAISLINDEIKFETVPYLAMQVTGVSLSAMLNDDSVARISLDQLDDGSLTKSLELIGADVVHAGGNTGAGQIVAVVGSGFSLSNVLGEYEACFSTVGSMVSSVCPNTTIEQVGAGAACGVFNCDHELKVAKVVTAVSPAVSLIPVQVYSEFALDCSGTMPCGRSFISDQVRALEYLLKLKQSGVDISAVNLSLNGGAKFIGACDEDSRKESVDNLLSVGVVSIASAGNMGFVDGLQAPACISSVVSVGATDADGNVAEFSNRGGDLLAPGVMVVDGEQVEGTSFAAPMVAGSYALVRAAKPDASVAEIMGMLKDSGQNIDGMSRIRIDKALIPQSNLDNGLLLHLECEENTQDSSGRNNHGIAIGNLSYSNGKIGKACSFDGTTSYIDIPNTTDFKFKNQSLTYSAWVMITDNANLYRPFITMGNNSNATITLSKARSGRVYGKIYMQFRENGKAETVTIASNEKGNVLPKHEWIQVTGVIDYKNKQIKLYINGIFQQSSPINDFDMSNDNPLLLRVGAYIHTYAYLHNDLIDDVRIYNRALSEPEIRQLADIKEEVVATNGCDVVSDGLVACYPLDGNAKDYSGNGNDGTVNGTVDYVDGIAGQAAKFDGTNNIFIENPSQIFDKQYTVSGWILTNGNGGGIAGKYSWINGVGGNGFNFLFDQADGIPRGNTIVAHAMFNENWNFDKYPQYDMPVGKFKYVSAVYDTGNIKIYINGNLKSEKNIQHNGTLNNTYKILIGHYEFDGLIDELRIYNRAITEQEIQTLYNFGQPVQSGLTVTKSGERGRILAKVNGEDWTLTCNSNCQQANYEYAPNSELTIRAYADKGFIFTGWTGDCTGTTSKLKLTLDTPKTCTAQFEPNTTNNLLTISKTGNGSITSTDGYLNCGETCSSSYVPNKKVTLTAIPATDQLFTGWTGDCNGINPKVSVTMDAAKTCSATFKPYDPTEEFILTVTKTNPQGIIKANVPSATLSCPKGCTEASYQYTSGDTVTITAKASTGFTFTGWTGDCNSTDNRLKILIDSAKNCTANYERDDTVDMYELKIIPIGTGKGIVTQNTLINCGNTCSALYIKDKTVWLKPESSPLSKFIGWGGDCTGNKVIITKDMTCTANFQSDLELVAQEMIDAFYATAKLADGSSIAEAYPRSTNEARLKEAFWLATTAIMQADQHLTISNSQSWPSQFNDIEWLPNDSSAKYTSSIKIMGDQFVGMDVELITADGTIKTAGIVTYYSDNPPDDGSSWRTSSAYFSRYAFRLW